MARDEDAPAAYEWRVTLTDDTEATVPKANGGVDVGMMSADALHFLVISDADNRAVWMHRADEVRKVTRCVG